MFITAADGNRVSSIREVRIVRFLNNLMLEVANLSCGLVKFGIHHPLGKKRMTDICLFVSSFGDTSLKIANGSEDRFCHFNLSCHMNHVK